MTPTIPTATGSAVLAGELGGVSHLADTPSVAYLPKTCSGVRQHNPSAVTRTSSRCRGRNAYGYCVPNQSPIATCVDRHAARQSYASLWSQSGRVVTGMSAGSNVTRMAEFRALTYPCQPGSLDGVTWTSIPAPEGLPEGRKWGIYG